MSVVQCVIDLESNCCRSGCGMKRGAGKGNENGGGWGWRGVFCEYP